jgi:hypothetical protein
MVANDVNVDSVTCTPAKVLNTVWKLKSSKSSEPDGFSAELFKKIGCALSEKPTHELFESPPIPGGLPVG